MSDIQLFYSEEFNTLRVSYDATGNPLFVAADVCRALGLQTSSYRRVDADEKGLISIQTPGGMQQVVAVTEEGFYSLVLKSRKKQARRPSSATTCASARSKSRTRTAARPSTTTDSSRPRASTGAPPLLREPVMAQVRVAEGQTSIFDLLEPQGEHTPGACVFETMRWSKKSCCTHSTKEEIGWGIAIVGGVFTIAACLVALPVFYIYGKTSGGH